MRLHVAFLLAHRLGKHIWRHLASRIAAAVHGLSVDLDGDRVHLVLLCAERHVTSRTVHGLGHLVHGRLLGCGLRGRLLALGEGSSDEQGADRKNGGDLE